MSALDRLSIAPPAEAALGAEQDHTREASGFNRPKRDTYEFEPHRPRLDVQDAVIVVAGGPSE